MKLLKTTENEWTQPKCTRHSVLTVCEALSVLFCYLTINQLTCSLLAQNVPSAAHIVSNLPLSLSGGDECGMYKISVIHGTESLHHLSRSFLSSVWLSCASQKWNCCGSSDFIVMMHWRKKRKSENRLHIFVLLIITRILFNLTKHSLTSAIFLWKRHQHHAKSVPKLSLSFQVGFPEMLGRSCEFP